MTITSETMRQPPQNGNNNTTSFDYSFKIFDDDDLLVIVVDSDGVETTQTKTTHYTVTGVESESGGTVDFVTAPATGETVHIILDPAFVQDASLNASAYERIFDKVVQMNQRIKDIASRALRVSDTSTADLDNLELTLGNDKILGTNSSGEVTALTLADIDGLVSVTAPLTYSGGVLGLSSTAPLNNSEATSPPTTSHDSSLGYSYHSRWGGPTLDEVWVCIDASVGAAVWVLFTGALASLDTVDTAEIEDDAITEAKIADDAVTADKLADTAVTPDTYKGADITVDAQGRITAADNGAGWEHISTTEVTTDVSSVDFTGLSAFRELRLTFKALPDTDGGNLRLRVSENNGTTFEASGYGYQATMSWYAGISYFQSNSATYLRLGYAVGNGTNEGCSGTIIFTDFNQITPAVLENHMQSFATDGRNRAWECYGSCPAAVNDALRFYFDGADVAKGRFILEGIRG